MPLTLVNVDIGAAPNDGTGDPARTAFDKINDNNDLLEAANTSLEAADDALAVLIASYSASIAAAAANAATALSTANSAAATANAAQSDANAAQADVDALTAIVNIIKVAYIGQNIQVGTTYTLVLEDAGKILDMDNAAAIALTIPENAAVAFPVNTRIDIVQYGAGQITVGITTDTLRGLTKSAGQYKTMSLWKRGATEWILSGGIA